MMPPRPPEGSVIFTLLLMLYTCILCTYGQTNNSVNDADGSIVWGELAPDATYKTVDYTAQGGLDPYYALAVSFIDTTLPETLPVGTVKDILDGKASFGDKWQDLAKQFVGFALCIVIGFLFIIIFPIVACCFCCCRCCGNCGGKRLQHQGPKDKCKRTVFAAVLSVLALFAIAGAACVYVSSDEFHQNLDGLNSSFSDAIDDFNIFVDNIDNQFRRLGDTNFNFLSGVLQNYVDGASSEVAEDIITAVNTAVNLDIPLNSISALSDTALAQVQELQLQVDILQTQRDTAKTQLQDLQTATCGNCLSTEITFLTAMDGTLATIRSEISTFKDEVSTDVFEKMKTDLDVAIKTEVEKGTSNLDVSGQLDGIYNDQIKGMLNQVSDLKTNLNKDAVKYQGEVDDYVQMVKPYEMYRWYAGVGLASLLMLVAVMMLVGVVLGCCCSSAHDRPTERGAASNCGGLCLMASVGLVFIFGALLMVLCTLMYMMGSLTERYVCQSLQHLDRLEQYASSLELEPDITNYTVTVNGQTVSFSLSQLMKNCEEGKTLYTALGLAGVVDTALDKIEDYKTDLSDINNIDFNKAAGDSVNQVDTDAEIAALQNTQSSINDVRTSIVSLKSNLETQQTNAENKAPGAGAFYDPMISSLTTMVTTCDNLITTSQNIVTEANSLNANELNDAKTKLNDPTFMETLIENVTSEFVNTIFGFVDSYINDIRTKLSDDVAKCTPFYSITNAVLNEAFCHGVVDPLNGFWLALGWCLFFFMPSLIIGVKLAKHYRIMLYEDQFDSTTADSPPPPYYTQASAPPAKTSLFPPITGPNNKVAPF